MNKWLVAVVLAWSVGLAHATGDFWIQGHTALTGDTEITRWCGVMKRFNQVDYEDFSTFDYEIVWYTDEGLVLRSGTGEVSNINRDVDWEDDIDLIEDGYLYLRGEGAQFTQGSLYWTGALWDAKGEQGMRDTEFWVVPINRGGTVVRCN